MKTQPKTPQPSALPCTLRARLTATFLPALLLLLTTHSSQAGSATWNLSPTSSDWNTAGNWTPAIVPNGPADTATFDSSSQTSISVSAATEVSEIVFDPGASAFTIAPKIALPATVLTISGAGITNNSGIMQNLATNANGGKTSEIHFTNSASAGSGIFITNHGSPIAGSSALTQFFDNATAGSATIINEGAGVAGASGSGATFFNDTSNAGTGVFINDRNQVGGVGYIYFNDTSSAANGIFTNDGIIFFNDTSTAADGIFTTSGQIDFSPDTDAGHGIFTVEGGQVSGGGGRTYFLRWELGFCVGESGSRSSQWRLWGCNPIRQRYCWEWLFQRRGAIVTVVQQAGVSLSPMGLLEGMRFLTLAEGRLAAQVARP